MSGASATILVRFGDGTTSASSINGHLSAELDTRTGGLNAGKTSFAPGETAWFLVYKTTNVNVSSVVSSAGTIGTGATISITKIEEITFEDTKQASLPVPASVITNNVWVGRSLGAVTLNSNKMGITADSSGVAISKVTFVTQALTYSITAPASINGETSFSLLVVVTGEEVVV